MSTVKRSSWRRPLGEEIQRYVRYKCALGHRHLIEESALCMLDRFLCERRVDQCSRGFAVRFTGMRRRIGRVDSGQTLTVRSGRRDDRASAAGNRPFVVRPFGNAGVVSRTGATGSLQGG